MIPIDFRTEEEARAFAASQPPGVIGVVPTTVTEPGSPKWQARETALLQAREAMALVRRETRRRAGRAVRMAVSVVVTLAVLYTAWAVYGLRRDGMVLRAPACVGNSGAES